MGKNFGVPSEFLVYQRKPGWTIENALAFTMLHDVYVRPNNVGDELRLIAPIWNALSTFQVDGAAWQPYWKNVNAVQTGSERIKVSYYQRGKALLVVVSNLSAEAGAEASVTFNPQSVGGQVLKAQDAITSELLKIENGVIHCKLDPMHARLVRVDCE